METNDTRALPGESAKGEETEQDSSMLPSEAHAHAHAHRKRDIWPQRNHGQCQRNGLQRRSKRRWRRPQQRCRYHKKVVSQRPREEQGISCEPPSRSPVASGNQSQ